MATPRKRPPPLEPSAAELVIAADEAVRLWFGTARLTAKGKDALATAMRQLRDVLKARA